MSDYEVLGPAGVAFDGRSLGLFPPLPNPTTTLLAQRRRLAERLEGLPADAWHAPTRCHLWDVADCVAHLLDTNRWSAAAIACAVDPSLPPPFQNFDNRRTPHEQVVAVRGRPVAELLDELVSGTEDAAGRMAAAIEDADHPSLRFAFGAMRPRTAAFHLLWDSVLHERDILLPLGVGVDHSDEELASVAPYIFIYAGVACGPFEDPLTVDISLTDRSPRSYRLVSSASGIEVHPAGPGTAHGDGDPAHSRLSGLTVNVVDALGGRIPLEGAVAVDGPFADRLPLTPRRLLPDPA